MMSIKLVTTICGLMILAANAHSATPVAQWLLDEGQGTITMDDMGTYNAPIYGNVTWVLGDVPAGTCLDYCVRFGGTANDYIALNNSGTLAPSAVTVAFWAKATGVHVGQAMLSKYWSAPGSFELGWGNNSNLYWRVWNEAGTNISAGSTAPNAFTSAMFNDGRWHFLAATADAAGGAKLYADGALIETVSMGGQSLRITGNPLLIGKRAYPGAEAAYSGMMSSVAIYDIALSHNEIIDLMAPPPQPGNVSGQVIFGDYNAAGDEARRLATPLVVEFGQNGSIVRRERVDLDEGGHFAIASVSAGTYDIALVASHFLRELIPGVIVNGPVSLGQKTLVNGDVDGDDEITSTDLSTVLKAMD